MDYPPPLPADCVFKFIYFQCVFHIGLPTCLLKQLGRYASLNHKYCCGPRSCGSQDAGHGIIALCAHNVYSANHDDPTYWTNTLPISFCRNIRQQLFFLRKDLTLPQISANNIFLTHFLPISSKYADVTNAVVISDNGIVTIVRFTLNSPTRIIEFRGFLLQFSTNFHEILHTLFSLHVVTTLKISLSFDKYFRS